MKQTLHPPNELTVRKTYQGFQTVLKSRQHAASLSRIIVSDKVPAQSSASHLVKPDQWKQVQTRTDHF